MGFLVKRQSEICMLFELITLASLYLLEEAGLQHNG